MSEPLDLARAAEMVDRYYARSASGNEYSTKRLSPISRMAIREARAVFGCVSLVLLAEAWGRSRQQISNITKGIIAGGGFDPQESMLRAAYERDCGRPVNKVEWLMALMLAGEEVRTKLNALWPSEEWRAPT